MLCIGCRILPMLTYGARTFVSAHPEVAVYAGPQPPQKAVTLRTLRAKYEKNIPISMVTAYDYPSAVHVRVVFSSGSQLPTSPSSVSSGDGVHGLQDSMAHTALLEAQVSQIMFAAANVDTSFCIQRIGCWSLDQSLRNLVSASWCNIMQRSAVLLLAGGPGRH
jgi:hypothetical protein